MKLIDVTVTKYNGESVNQAMALNTESISYVTTKGSGAEITYYDLMSSARPIKIEVAETLDEIADKSNQLFKARMTKKGSLDISAKDIGINLDRIIIMTALDTAGGDDVTGGVWTILYDESKTNFTGIDAPFAQEWQTVTDMEDLGPKMVSLVGNVATGNESGVAVESLSVNGVDVSYPAGTLAWFGVKRVSGAFEVASKAVVKFKASKAGYAILKTGITLAALVGFTQDIDCD